jgi:hypothetical protein
MRLTLSAIALLIMMATGAAHAANPSHLALLVQWDGSRFTIEKTTLVPSALPKQRMGTPQQAWRYQVLAPDNSVLYAAGLIDPTVLRGEFAASPKDHRIVGTTVVKSLPVTFVVRVPLLDALRTLTDAVRATPAGDLRVEIERLRADLPREKHVVASAYEHLGTFVVATRKVRP